MSGQDSSSSGQIKLRSGHSGVKVRSGKARSGQYNVKSCQIKLRSSSGQIRSGQN